MRKKRVMIGSSAVHDYSFFLPLTGIFWKEIAGYDPTFLLVGDFDHWMKLEDSKLVYYAPAGSYCTNPLKRVR